jgi:uncharacterized membrane protein
MRMARLPVYFLLGLACLFGATSVRAADAKVQGLLFYNPACPHCLTVMNSVLPPLATKFDRQLEILPVDVTTSLGGALFQAAIEKYSILPENRFVPIMVVGDAVLIGSDEIESKLSGLIAAKLQTGGTAYPNLPGMEDFLRARGALPAASQKPLTFPQTFFADQTANSLAVLVLLLLCASLIWSIVAAFSDIPSFLKRIPAWVFPVSLVIGFAIAGYLSYTETTHSEVVCGVVGHCNAVQNSPYAQILGFIPLGIFGLAGYIAIGLSWVVFTFTQNLMRAIAAIAMFGFGVFGLSFSIYLTFLEPFVIGATCIWCLGSATVLALLLPQTVAGVRETIDRYGLHLAVFPGRAG